jgi:hypothetical protein
MGIEFDNDFSLLGEVALALRDVLLSLRQKLSDHLGLVHGDSLTE